MSNAPEGWYADPASSGHQRYWTGTAWTEHLKANDPPPIVASAESSTPAATFAPSGPGSPRVTSPGNGVDSADPFAAYGTQFDNSRAAQNAPIGEEPRGFQFGGVEVNGMAFGRAFNATSATVGRVGSLRNAIAGVALTAIFLIAGNLMLNLFAGASTAPEGSFSAVGNIVSLDDSSLSSELCKPHVEYVVAGETHTVISPLATDPCPWIIGQAVTVAYFPDDIDGTALIVDESNTILYLRIAVNGMGGLALVASVVSLVRRLR